MKNNNKNEKNVSILNSGRSLHSECSADALQYGRSMIEMLGVLAIIGVLSVGGIAGFSKAMMKFKINKSISLITEVSQNVRTFFAPQKNYKGINNSDLWYKAKLIPEDLDTDEGLINTPFGADTEYLLYEHSDGKFFSQYFWNIPSNACIELAIQDWSNVASGCFAIIFGSNNDLDMNDYFHDAQEDNNDILSNCQGVKFENSIFACARGNISMPISLEDAVKYCGNCNDACSIELFFK